MVSGFADGLREHGATPNALRRHDAKDLCTAGAGFQGARGGAVGATRRRRHDRGSLTCPRWQCPARRTKLKR
jgi:hypothetical protein